MSDNNREIQTLNSLIATTLDSVEGYREAAEEIESHRFSPLFTARAQERRLVVSELQTQVRHLGGEPEDDGTILAGAHRVFLDLKAKLTGHDDKAVINEVERGEDHIKAKFEDALADNDLSPATKEVVRAANQSVRAGHDQMSALKHNMEV